MYNKNMVDILNKNIFCSAKEYAENHNITSRRIRVLASQGRILGAVHHPKAGWRIPRLAQVSSGARGPEFGLKRQFKTTTKIRLFAVNTK